MTRESKARSSLALPHAELTEADVLASGLMDERYWPLAESLDTDVESLFYEPNHHRVASAMHRLFVAGKVVNESSVVDMLRAAQEDLDGGTRAYLVSLGMRSSVRTQMEFKSLISSLAEQRSLRQIATGAGQIAERARSGDVDPAELTEEILTLAERGRTTAQPLRRFGEVIDELDTAVSSCVPTGLDGLDKIINGWEAGRMYVMAARPKMGKTALALNSVAHALESGAVVLHISLEMPKRELWGRLLATTALVPSSQVTSLLNGDKSLDDFPQSQREALEECIEGVRGSDLYIAEAGDVRGISDVMAAIVDVKSRYPEDRPFIVFVDYLQLLIRDARDATAEVTNYTRELKLMAGRMDIPIVVLSQINRGGADTDGGMPSPHQMRNSGSIEQDADVVMLLNRRHEQDEDHPETDMDIWVALSRYSRSGWIKAHFSPEEQAITDPVGGTDVAGSDDGAQRRSSRPAGTSTRVEQAAGDDSGAHVDEFDFDGAASEFGNV